MRIVFLFLFFFQMPAVAGVNPYCTYFQNIQTTMKKIDKAGVKKILPNAQWVEDERRSHNLRQNGKLLAKTIILGLLKKISVTTYLFEPTRAGVSTVTGYYVNSPENFARFLELPPKSACSYLGLGDRHADILRELTYEVWLNVKRAK